jgi:hypothetical protein
MKRPMLTNFLAASSRLQHESQYWTGYDHTLIDQIGDEAKKIEEVVNEMYDELLYLRLAKRVVLSKFAIVLFILSLLIGFCVHAGTHWSDAYKSARKKAIEEIRIELDKGEFEKLGYEKQIIGNPSGGYATYTIYIKRN